jgi:hypothetical protein
MKCCLNLLFLLFPFFMFIFFSPNICAASVRWAHRATLNPNKHEDGDRCSVSARPPKRFKTDDPSRPFRSPRWRCPKLPQAHDGHAFLPGLRSEPWILLTHGCSPDAWGTILLVGRHVKWFMKIARKSSWFQMMPTGRFSNETQVRSVMYKGKHGVAHPSVEFPS